ncbi:hypothetical protein HYFRA_00002570 [Hymenoscyphus fraxineus]|uniref:Transfer RNA methyltransferase 82 n=1 Tax=Hymenoscyphus fraxineus TaxID=746836 RepID=A0A9N9L623_9HELO|nr:hypothetical protein HYFRA_00002570 [Hymenoscyphus fraxineus]
MPYQCLEKCGEYLVAARDSNIDLFHLSNGEYISTWSCPLPQVPSKGRVNGGETTKKQEIKEAPLEGEVDASAPPAKRRKVDTEDEKKSEEKVEEKSEPKVEPKVNENGEKKQQKKQRPNHRTDSIAAGQEPPSVIALAVAKNAQHVVAITGEDKCIRVFEIVVKEGKPFLNHLSQRVMPKRPSAVAISSDSATIISADKFGDVYSLPLIPSATSKTQSTPEQTSRESSTLPERTFKPAANELTIHSQRNRKALENQKRQTNTAPEKTGPDFEHTLLLGHVSLLTELKLATSNGRDYIITADRDEHIRVNRGIPYAHIIEGFCFGHKDFISRLCNPESRPELLISGGGESDVLVFDWVKGSLLSQVEPLLHIKDSLNDFDLKERKTTVSGIYHTRKSSKDIIIFTYEAIPALFVFSISEENNLTHVQTLPLIGNPLCLVIFPSTKLDTASSVIVSVDYINKPGTTAEPREKDDQFINPLQHLILSDGVLTLGDELPSRAEALKDEKHNSAKLKNLLYGLENLRKRAGEDRGDGGDGDDA